MISSASDYVWVNASAVSGYISGDIMPVRDNRADGSWRRIKYEDLLFLMEAQLERANWQVATPGASVSPLGRLLKRSYALGVGIWPSTSGWVADYVDRAAAIPSGIVGTTSTQSIAAACGLVAAPFAARPAATQPKLAADDIRTMHYNVKLATRTVSTVTTADIASAWMEQTTYTRSDGTTTTNAPTTEWGLLWRHSNATRVGSPYSTVSIAYKSTMLAAPYATAATLLVKTYTVAASGGTWYDVVPVSCSIANGEVTVPSLAGVAPLAAAAHGLNYTAAPGYITSGGGEVSVSGLAVVIDHEFPAEINSLNWSWSPQTQS